MKPEPTPRQRTIQQNKALHVLFQELADELNSHGLDMRKTLNPGVDIPWNATTIKEYLWRPVQKAQLNKRSTTELTTKEIDMVFDTINKHIGEKFGLHIEFPSIESLMFKKEYGVPKHRPLRGGTRTGRAREHGSGTKK